MSAAPVSPPTEGVGGLVVLVSEGRLRWAEERSCGRGFKGVLIAHRGRRAASAPSRRALLHVCSNLCGWPGLLSIRAMTFCSSAASFPAICCKACVFHGDR